jgi:hypothetical protein
MVVRFDEQRLTQREQLEARAEARRQLMIRQAEHDLFTFIRLHQPRYRKPAHMWKLVDAFDRMMRGEQVLVAVEAPSRHFKTAVLLAAAARFLRYRPTKSVGYCTYANDIAFRRSREVRELAARAGVWVSDQQQTENAFDPSKSVSYWQTDEGGKFIAGGRHGQWIGEGLDLIIYDDPIKDPAEAESQVARDEAWKTLRGTLMNRLEPGGSVFLSHQRWNEDDPIGRLKDWQAKDPNAPRFTIITLRAIEDIQIETDEQGHERIVGGTPLCPERYSLEQLVVMAGLTEEYFWPNFQQDVRPRGKRVFPELARFDEPYKGRSILLASCDPGIEKSDATEKKKRKPDAYGLVVAYAYVGKDKRGQERLALDVIHAEEGWLDPIDLLERLEVVQVTEYPGVPMLLEEVSAFKILELVAPVLSPQLQVTAIVPHGSKLLRVQPVAAGARHSLVRVPLKGAWVDPFCKEVRDFTGKGRSRNMVDALSQLYQYAGVLLGIESSGAEAAGESTLRDSPW